MQTSDIKDFLSELHKGFASIKLAGEKLVLILDADKNAYAAILNQGPTWLSMDVLRTIESVGRGEIAPEMLILPRHVFLRLAALPISEQLRLVNSPVPVVSKGGRVLQKPASKLTMSEAKRALSSTGLRSVEDQLNFMKTRKTVATYIFTIADNKVSCKLTDLKAWTRVEIGQPFDLVEKL